MKKIITCMVLILAMCFQFITVSAQAEVNPDNTVYISDDNFAAKQGDAIYFKKSTYSLNICSLNDNLKGKAAILSDTTESSYFISKGWIYFFSGDKLYRMKNDGTGKKLVTDQKIYVIDIEDNWIYCRVENDYDTLYRMKCDGTGIESLVNFEYCLIKDDWIYYSNTDDGQKLYKVKTDGSCNTKLSETKASNFVDIKGDWLYFRNAYLYKIKTDGTGEKKLTEDSVGNVRITGDYIYYNYYSYSNFTKQTQYGNLYRIKTDGTGKTTIVEGQITGIDYIGEGYIYYSDFSMQTYSTASTTMYNNLYKVKTTGGSSTPVSEIIYGKKNGFLYYEKLKDNKLYRKNLKTSAVTKVLDIPINYNVTEGNAIANIVFDGDRIYYCANMADNYIYKIPAAGGKEQRLTDTEVNSAYISGSRIFYVRKDNSTLWKMKIDGSDKSELMDSKADIFAASGDWIYYIPEPLTYCRISANKKTKQTIYTASTFSEKIVNFQVIDDYYYFSCEDKKIYKQKEGSSNKELLAESAYDSKFWVDGDWIYYSSYWDHKVYKVNIKNSERQDVAEDKYLSSIYGIYDGKLLYLNYIENKVYSVDLNSLSKEILCDSSVFSNYSSGWIYSLEVGTDNEDCISRTSIKDNVKQEIVRGDIDKFMIVGDWIFYKSPTYTGKCDFYRIKLDGTGKTK